MCTVHNWSRNIVMRSRIAGDFSLGKLNVTLDCFCGRLVGTLVDSMRGSPNVRVTGNGALWRVG